MAGSVVVAGLTGRGKRTPPFRCKNLPLPRASPPRCTPLYHISRYNEHTFARTLLHSTRAPFRYLLPASRHAPSHACTFCFLIISPYHLIFSLPHLSPSFWRIFFSSIAYRVARGNGGARTRDIARVAAVPLPRHVLYLPRTTTCLLLPAYASCGAQRYNIVADQRVRDCAARWPHAHLASISRRTARHSLARISCSLSGVCSSYCHP